MAVEVFDHTLVRWLERVKGVDLQPFRDEIGATVEDAISCGATRVRVAGFVYQLDPAFRRVVTVLPKGRRANVSQQEVR